MSRLPDGYTELEYIESNGTQYINTGFKPSGNTRLISKFETFSFSSMTALFGCRDTGSATASNQFMLWNLSSGTFRTDYFGANASIYDLVQSGIHNLDKNKNVTTLDGNSVSSTIKTGSCSYPLILMGGSSAGTVSWKAKMRLYSCSVYDNDEQAFDFVPCKNSSGEIGLYDLVTSSFFANAGTGSFTAGPEIIIPDPPGSLSQKTAVALSWGAVECDGYKIYKNGSLLTTTTQTLYVDYAVSDGQDIEYSITAYNGDLESDPVTLSVQIRAGYTILIPVVQSAFFQ